MDLDDPGAFDELRSHVDRVYANDFLGGSSGDFRKTHLIMQRRFCRRPFDPNDDDLERVFAVYCVARRNAANGHDVFERKKSRARFGRVLESGFLAVFDPEEVVHGGWDAIEKLYPKFDDAHVDVLYFARPTPT